MKRAGLTSSTALAVITLFSAWSFAQSKPSESGSPRGGGGERSGVAVPRGSGGSGGSGGNSGGGSSVGSSGGSSSSSVPSSGGVVAGHGRDRASSRSAPERRHAPPASAGGSARSRVPASGGTGSEPNAIGPEREAPQYARPRGGRPAVSSAVPRSEAPLPPNGGYYPIYPGYRPGFYYPGYWGFGAFYYDPWWWGGYSGYPYGYGGYGYGGYGYGGYGYSGSAYYGDYGKLRLKVKPREAQVSVDGYFSGTVDQFDGVFQRLTLKAGGHRVEIRADGFQTLSFEVMIIPHETVTYSGELKRAP